MSNKEKDSRDGLFGSLSIAVGGTLLFLMLNSSLRAEFGFQNFIFVFIGFFLVAFGIALMFDKI